MDRFRDVELSPGPDVQTDEQIDAFVRGEPGKHDASVRFVSHG